MMLLKEALFGAFWLAAFIACIGDWQL